MPVVKESKKQQTSEDRLEEVRKRQQEKEQKGQELTKADLQERLKALEDLVRQRQ